MPYGMNTRQVGIPIGANLRNRFTVPVRYVPLSQFFLSMSGEGDDGEKGLYGRKEPLKKKTAKDKGKESEGQGNQVQPKDGAKEAIKAEKDVAQSTALPEEGAPGVYKAGPGGPSAGFTGTGNIPQVAVPIGQKKKRKLLLRRVVPVL